MNHNKRKLPVLQLWRMAPDKGLFIIQIILQIFLTGTSVYVSNLSRRAIDEELVVQQLTLVVITFTAIFLSGTIAQYASGMAGNTFSITLTQRIRELCAERLMHCNYSYIEQEHSGTILNKIDNDVEQVSTYISTGFLELIRNTITFVCTFIYLLTVNWLMTCICALCVPVAVIISKKFANPTYQIMDQFFEQMDELAVMAKDSVMEAKVERAYGLHDLRTNEFNRKMNHATKLYVDYSRIVAKAGAYKYLLRCAPTFICILVAFVVAYSGHITSGAFAAFILLMGNITDPLSKFIGYITDYKEAEVSMNRVLEILDLPQEDEKATGERCGQERSGKEKAGKEKAGKEKVCEMVDDPAGIQESSLCYEFRKVGFSYENDQYTLRDLSGEIRKGQMTAIVGGSGAGKSTLFKLLTGFYKPTQGEILLYGKPVNQWTLDSMREKIAYVEQIPVLFHGTIAENIGLGKENVTLDQIVKAAQMAYAHDFIMQQPQGYQTVLQENGGNLSGGQRQRIAIARALCKDAPILLMDEMTSALDVESEKLIQKTIDEYRANKTIVLIAHRLSTIQNADQILVLDQGNIAEQGTHEELMKRAGLYSKLYSQNSQQQNTQQQNIQQLQMSEIQQEGRTNR